MKHINLLFGIIYFIVFGIDIEYDRDVWTWFWLLLSILNLLAWAIHMIKLDVIQIMEESEK